MAQVAQGADYGTMAVQMSDLYYHLEELEVKAAYKAYQIQSALALTAKEVYFNGVLKC